ncbi:MAG: hypothetical protein LBK82_04730 [Planctomycetaceae bacterium]|nr:hypothetical protein [Planctomycetaceae bacterium]
MTPKRKATPFAVIKSNSQSTKMGGRPFAERSRRRSPTVNQINDSKLCCLPFWSQCRVNRRDPSAKGRPPLEAYTY